MTSTLLSSIASFFKPPSLPGSSDENRLDVYAVPGLMTLLDVSLYRALEGELTSTVATGHALLTAWLDLKEQAIIVLQELKYEVDVGTRRVQMESFARACLEAACDALERLTTDKFAISANLSDPYEHSSSHHSSSASGSQHFSSGITSQSAIQSLQESSQDTGRRHPLFQRPRDCWESPRLHCPDYVWADDAAQNCQRLLRHLYKHPFGAETVEHAFVGGQVLDLNRQRLTAEAERQAALLQKLIQIDIPARLMQFSAAMEAESVVLKRLYLVKCEYRAPFRAFLEAHQSVLRAPSLELVDEYLEMSKTKNARRRTLAKDHLQELLEEPHLVEALALEQRCEEYEMDMAKALFSFCELARFLEHKRAQLKVVPGVLHNQEDLVDLKETLRRLKGLLCRKAGPDTSTGIRPLLLDLQGVPRDDDGHEKHEEYSRQDLDNEAVMRRLKRLIDELKTLGSLCESRNAFYVEKKSDVDLPSSIVRGCTKFDHELFSCQFQDWYAMVERQHELTNNNQTTDFDKLAENLRRAEMQMSLAVAPNQSLEVVRQRVQMITSDREKRFEVLKEMIEEVCRREMNLYVNVVAPKKDMTLSLQRTSALGVFGLALEMAGETLPIG